MPQYLTTEELSTRIKYTVRYIREHLKDRVFVEGVHYMRPFGGRKLLFVWEAVEQRLLEQAAAAAPQGIPLRRWRGR